jgi:hypothetical protein
MPKTHTACANGKGVAGRRAESPFAEFLRTVGPKAQRLIGRYRLAPDAAEAVLRDTVETLVWKWETVRDRETWLLAVLQRKCEVLSSSSNIQGQP